MKNSHIPSPFFLILVQHIAALSFIESEEEIICHKKT
jgi:hypothetical protein